MGVNARRTVFLVRAIAWFDTLSAVTAGCEPRLLFLYRKILNRDGKEGGVVDLKEMMGCDNRVRVVPFPFIRFFRVTREKADSTSGYVWFG